MSDKFQGYQPDQNTHHSAVSGQTLEAAIADLDGFYTFAVGTRDGFSVLRDPIACKPAVMAETDDWVAMASEFRSLAQLPGVDDATVAARARELLANDGEIKRQFDNRSLTVSTLRTAVATSLGVDEEAIKKVVNATLILGTPRRYLLDQVRAELREQDDGSDSDVGAYFELSD